MDVVPHEFGIAYVVEEASKGFFGREMGTVAILFDHRIGEVTQHFGDGAVGLDDEVEFAAFDHLAIAELDGRNLDDVVVEDIGACGLCVEDHEGASPHAACSFQTITAAVVVDEVGGCEADGAHAA